MCLSVNSRVQTSYSRTWTNRTKLLLTAYRHFYKSSLIVSNGYGFVQKVWTSGGIRNWGLFDTKWRVLWVYFPRIRFRLEKSLFVNARFYSPHLTNWLQYFSLYLECIVEHKLRNPPLMKCCFSTSCQLNILLSTGESNLFIFFLHSCVEACIPIPKYKRELTL